MIDFLQAAAVILGILGAVLISSPMIERRKKAFSIWIVANSTWVIIGAATQNPYLFALFSVYLVTAVRGRFTTREGVPDGR